ncbi:STAS domain-containing protein [Domibacillus sp. PGB-M46]|uniref:STAS domain-containing protein n=1 Tax=Domibacillus sp. PGB-M46 TaxID=2910255 RepID=UPI001F57FDB5|nr:STAS domain-containing protein [Domibacillus sp. PGB-M46]MCI2255740.1 STAS domain-containing protein [Domibacillus sp. PGB-M46]
MSKYTELYNYLMNRTEQLTEEWYKTIEKEHSSGVYVSSNTEEIRLVKEQNNAFHKQFFQVFLQDEMAAIKQFEEWIVKVASDQNHLLTPAHQILKEYYRTRDQYVELIEEFVSLHKGKYSQADINSWNKKINKIMDKVTVWFMEEHNKYLIKRLQDHQELIYELSSPVINLNDHIGILPIIGDIDTTRAKLILENTLEQCAEKGLDVLYIDLSGVVAIDTMVAHQIFQLHNALSLIGVKVTLSGIRPEIAQTAIQLGLSFDKIPVTSSLSRALHYNPESV